MRAQLEAALTAAHAIDRSAAIELGPAFTQPEQRTVAEEECKLPRLAIDAQPLHTTSVFRINRDHGLLAVGSDANDQIAGADRLAARQVGDPGDWRRPSAIDEPVVGQFPDAGVERHDADSYCCRTRGCDDDLNGTARNCDGGR